MLFSKFIVAAIAALALLAPTTAQASASGEIGTAVATHGTHNAGCWTAWAKRTERSSSHHKIGVSWLHARACGPLRNVRGTVSCKDYRRWTCDSKSTYTFKVYPVKNNRHERKLVGSAGISRQLTPSTAKGIVLTTCMVVERNVGFVHLCRKIPRR